MNTGSKDLEKLIDISKDLENQYSNYDEDWKGSPFAWIKSRPSRQVGAIGEQIVEAWLQWHKFCVNRSPDADADRLVEGKRVEIKFSTLWKGGIYTFQQIRNQNYELLICLGISPDNAHCWIIPKEVAMDWWEQGIIKAQHKGEEGTDTAWISFDVNNPPIWLAPYGGSLEDALRILRDITGSPGG